MNLETISKETSEQLPRNVLSKSNNNLSLLNISLKTEHDFQFHLPKPQNQQIMRHLPQDWPGQNREAPAEFAFRRVERWAHGPCGRWQRFLGPGLRGWRGVLPVSYRCQNVMRSPWYQSRLDWLAIVSDEWQNKYRCICLNDRITISTSNMFFFSKSLSLSLLPYT